MSSGVISVKVYSLEEYSEILVFSSLESLSCSNIGATLNSAAPALFDEKETQPARAAIDKAFSATPPLKMQ